MRTTLDLDDDIAIAVKERARRERRSAGRVLSDLARQALTAGGAGADTAFMGFRPTPAGGVVVTRELVDRIRDDEGI